MTVFFYIYTCIANFTDVDTPDLGSGAERREGSSPFRGTSLISTLESRT